MDDRIDHRSVSLGTVGPSDSAPVAWRECESGGRRRIAVNDALSGTHAAPIRYCDAQDSAVTMPGMWQRLWPVLLVIGAVGANADGGVSPWAIRPALAVHRAALGDLDAWALVHGPLGARPYARIASASPSARDARLPIPHHSAVLADSHRAPGLSAGARLAGARVSFGLAPFRRGSASRAPPGPSAPLR